MLIESGTRSARRFLAYAIVLPCLSASHTITAQVSSQDAGERLDGFWLSQFQITPYSEEAQAMIDGLPEGTHLLLDVGTVPEYEIGYYQDLKVTPQAREAAEHYDHALHRSPAGACRPPAITYVMQAPFPMEVHVGADMIIMKMEYYDMVRVIFMDGRDHPPADAPHSNAGHSVGYWEGGDLVVDTTHISSGTIFNNGLDHSENLHMTERFRVSDDGSTLHLTQIYEDPETFEGLAARYIAFDRSPNDGYVYSYDCDPSYAMPDPTGG